MKKTGQISIDDLYFGVVLDDWSGKNRASLKAYNLFDLSKVKWAVAYWVVSSDDFKKEHDLIAWCFGDVWARCEYEFVVCPWGGLEEDAKVEEVGQKVDTYFMYVKPNEQLLTKMVESVSVASAERYLSAERKVYKNAFKR